MASLFLCLSSFPTAYEVLSKNPLMTDLSRSLYGVQAKVFSSIKPLISILKSSRDDGRETQITSVLQMLCSINLVIIRLHGVFVAHFSNLSIINPWSPLLPLSSKPNIAQLNAEEGEFTIKQMKKTLLGLKCSTRCSNSGASFPTIMNASTIQFAGIISRYLSNI